MRYVTSARRRPSPDLPGRAALPHHRVRRRLSRSCWRAACTSPSRPRPARRSRRASSCCRSRCARSLDLLPRCRPSCARPSRRRPRPACWPTSPRPISTPRRPRSRTSSRRSTWCRGSTRSPSCWPVAWRCCGCRPRSATRPRPRSTRASARCCCASRWPPSSASWATRAPTSRSWPISRRRSPRPRCRPRSRRWRSKELRRLQRTPEAAAEYGMIRTYLDTLLELPWAPPEPKDIDIAEARRVLDADHYGLEKIKQRIIEYLAVRKLAPEGKAPILCFVGPPGVGKTSLGQSIARAMGRKFARVSLGGVHDEAEIRGHRRTYIGALPGNIIQAIRKAGARDCVMMLDEIDKMGTGIHGDPSAAMLEVLDPEQNGDLPRQLSRRAVRPQPRRVHHHGQHAGHHSRAAARPHGDHRALRLHRGREARDRQALPGAPPARGQRAEGRSRSRSRTPRCGASSTATRARRACATSSARSAACCAMSPSRSPRARPTRSISASPTLEKILGPVRFENEVAMRSSVPGVATGLAWTPVGGDILFIEATRTPGGGRLLLTGQLGEVMRESAQAALSLVKSQAAALEHRSGAVREERHPRPRAGRRHAQGRAERRRRHVHGADLAADRPRRSAATPR